MIVNRSDTVQASLIIRLSQTRTIGIDSRREVPEMMKMNDILNRLRLGICSAPHT